MRPGTGLTDLGKAVKAPYKNLNLTEDIEVNRVCRLGFEHSTYEIKCSKILDGLLEVTREV